MHTIPVVVLTTSRDRNLLLRIYALGGSSFITKPSIYKDMIKAMESLCAYWFDTVSLPDETGHEDSGGDLRSEQHHQNDQTGCSFCERAVIQRRQPWKLSGLSLAVTTSLQPFLFYRQIDDQCRSFSRHAFGSNLAPVTLDYLAAYGEPHTGSFILTAAMQSLEWSENQFSKSFFETNAIILNEDLTPPAIALCMDFDSRALFAAGISGRCQSGFERDAAFHSHRLLIQAFFRRRSGHLIFEVHFKKVGNFTHNSCQVNCFEWLKSRYP